MSEIILEIKNLKKYFPVFGGILRRQVASNRAVDDVSFSVNKGETIGIVGESGCGKSTIGRTILRLYEPTSGSVVFDNTDITKLNGDKLKHLRRHMQMIFQDPYASLNPRHSVGRILSDPFIVHAIGNAESRKEEIIKLLKKVGLSESTISKFPHEFSGGQRQRIGIARAIALKPKLVICDEPVSALDVSIQSQVLNLLMDLQDEMQLTYLFISHDLAVVRHISDKVIVMYLGKIVEMTDSDRIYHNPLHPYTKALLSAIPEPDLSTRTKKRQILTGDVPSPINPPSGCRFHTRCPQCKDICTTTLPELKNALNNNELGLHVVACHFVN